MGRITQSNGSSPLDPTRYKVTKKDRRTLSGYDLHLHYVKKRIKYLKIIRPYSKEFEREIDLHNKIDNKRRILRLKMKGQQINDENIKSI